MIKIANYEQEGNIAKFDISGIDVKTLNTFRRTIISAVPVMAIEHVTFYNNSSILNDEALGHRLGLIPISTDLKTYTMRSDCSCKEKGCGKCVCKLTLDVTGPKTVYSGELQTKDENIKPVHEKIPLGKLMVDQKIKLEADAILGLGSEHVKWQPGIASYEMKDKNTFQVTVESYGQLPVEELIKTAFEVVDAKIKEIKDKLT
ncbi:MAG: DNA-directed RNA polymerase subunit D [Candidatus Altiarchaeota archaeon]